MKTHMISGSRDATICGAVRGSKTAVSDDVTCERCSKLIEAMPRMQCQRVPPEVEEAYARTRAALLRHPTNRGAGIAGMCIEAVATMYVLLAEHLGYSRYELATPPELYVVRRAIEGDPDDGHWTIVYLDDEGSDFVEYDPTIGDWALFRKRYGSGGMAVPRGARAGCLYVVGEGSSIAEWPITDRSDEDYRVLYEIMDLARSGSGRTRSTSRRTGRGSSHGGARSPQ